MRCVVSVVTLALVGALTGGCAGASDSEVTPTVSRDALQKDVADKLSVAGEPARTVVCESDLVGEVGRTAYCDVAAGSGNGFQPIVTVTGTDDGAIQYDLTPALSREQLEAAVARLVAEKSYERVDSVSCGTGLTGRVGVSAECDVVAAGVQARRVVEVTDVSGLTMNFSLRTS